MIWALSQSEIFSSSFSTSSPSSLLLSFSSLSKSLTRGLAEGPFSMAVLGGDAAE